MLVQPTDEQLLAGLSAGEVQALVALYERYERPVYSFAMQSLGDAAEAQLVLWLTFRRLWSEAVGRARQGPLAPWVYQTTQAVAAEHWRDRRGQRDNQGDTAPAADDTTAVYLLSRQLRRTLLAMPSNLLQAFELAYFRGYTQAELARRLGVTPQTAGQQLAEAFDKLRATLHTPAPAGLGRHGLDRVQAAAYACAQLAPEAAQRFEQHLATCKRCRREFTAYQAVGEALQLSVPQLEPSYYTRVWMLRHIRAEALDMPLEPMPPPVQAAPPPSEVPETNQVPTEQAPERDVVTPESTAELLEPSPGEAAPWSEAAPEAALPASAAPVEPPQAPAAEADAATCSAAVVETAPEPALVASAPVALSEAALAAAGAPVEARVAAIAERVAEPVTQQLPALPGALPPAAVQPVPMAIAPLAHQLREGSPAPLPPEALRLPLPARPEPKPRRPGRGGAERKPRRTHKLGVMADGEVAVTAETRDPAAKPVRWWIKQGVLTNRLSAPGRAPSAADETTATQPQPVETAPAEGQAAVGPGRTVRRSAAAPVAVPAVAVARPRRGAEADQLEVVQPQTLQPGAAPQTMPGPRRLLLTLIGGTLVLALGVAAAMTYSSVQLWRRVADLEYVAANRDVQLRQAEDALAQARQSLAASQGAGATGELRVIHLQPASGNVVGQAVFQSTGPGRGLQVHLAGVPQLKGAQVLAVWLIGKNGTPTVAGPSFLPDAATGRAGFTGAYKPSADVTRILVTIEPDTAARTQPGTVLLSSDI